MENTLTGFRVFRKRQHATTAAHSSGSCLVFTPPSLINGVGKSSSSGHLRLSGSFLASRLCPSSTAYKTRGPIEPVLASFHPHPAVNPSDLIMSGKLDQSLDEILSSQRRSARQPRTRRLAGSHKASAVSPVGGVKKHTAPSKSVARVKIPSGPGGLSGDSKVIVSNLVGLDYGNCWSSQSPANTTS